MEISLTNKDETAALNVPEEALVYKIEGVSLTKETEKKFAVLLKKKKPQSFVQKSSCLQA